MLLTKYKDGEIEQDTRGWAYGMRTKEDNCI